MEISWNKKANVPYIPLIIISLKYSFDISNGLILWMNFPWQYEPINIINDQYNPT